MHVSATEQSILPERKPLPDNFLHLRQSLSFLRGSFTGNQKVVIGDEGRRGVRFSFGMFAVEYYTGDKEPTLEPFRGLRFITWDRVMYTEKSKDWRYMMKGFKLAPCALVNLSEEEYWQEWTKTLRQYRSKWEVQNEYEINKVDRNEFVSYYKMLGRPRSLVRAAVEALDSHIQANKDNVGMFILKHRVSGEVVAGIGTIDAKDVNQSYYLMAFLNKKTAPKAAGLWLINNWMKLSKQKGITFANFGVVWEPGESKGWKGFTEFKMHFHPLIMEYQRPLFRFTFSLKEK